MNRLAFWLTLVLPLASLQGGHTEDDMPPRLFNPLLKRMVCRKVDQPPKIDAHLEDAAWQVSDIAAEFSSLSNSKPTNPTTWVTCHDARFIYFAFLCRDDQVIATSPSGEEPPPADSVEIDLVTDGALGADHRFGLTAAGSRWQARHGDRSWKPLPDWSVATRTTDTGWTAELAIPLESVTTENKPEEWLVRVLRWDISTRRNSEASSWTFFGKPGVRESSVYGDFFFDSNNLSGKRRILQMVEPDRPADYVPDNGAMLAQRPRVIRWAEEPAAIRYELQVSRSPDFPSRKTMTFVTSGPKADPSSTYHPLVGHWYWRYRIRTADARVTCFGQTRSFVVLPAKK
ncbi:MAG: hypothetical protein HY318_18345 [Armatimonadetes bacterium]|nr:hypothetical protein [Armatimonadota bacterium]